MYVAHFQIVRNWDWEVASDKLCEGSVTHVGVINT
jgi:hypothetical protein